MFRMINWYPQVNTFWFKGKQNSETFWKGERNYIRFDQENCVTTNSGPLSSFINLIPLCILQLARFDYNVKSCISQKTVEAIELYREREMRPII